MSNGNRRSARSPEQPPGSPLLDEDRLPETCRAAWRLAAGRRMLYAEEKATVIRIRALTSADLPLGFRLSRQAGWNQTGADGLRFLDGQPDGGFVAESDGIPAGTTVTPGCGCPSGGLYLPGEQISRSLGAGSDRGRGGKGVVPPRHGPRDGSSGPLPLGSNAAQQRPLRTHVQVSRPAPGRFLAAPGPRSGGGRPRGLGTIIGKTANHGGPQGPEGRGQDPDRQEHHQEAARPEACQEVRRPSWVASAAGCRLRSVPGAANRLVPVGTIIAAF